MDVNQRAVEPVEASFDRILGMGGADVPCVCARETDLFLRMRLEECTRIVLPRCFRKRCVQKPVAEAPAQEIKARKNLVVFRGRQGWRVKEHLSYRLGKEIVEAGHRL